MHVDWRKGLNEFSADLDCEVDYWGTNPWAEAVPLFSLVFIDNIPRYLFFFFFFGMRALLSVATNVSNAYNIRCIKKT